MDQRNCRPVLQQIWTATVLPPTQTHHIVVLQCYLVHLEN